MSRRARRKVRREGKIDEWVRRGMGEWVRRKREVRVREREGRKNAPLFANCGGLRDLRPVALSK